MIGAVNLSTLPPPQVIEELDFEAIVTRQKQKFQELWEAVKASNPDLDLPDYNVEMLETDPVVILIQAESYQELVLRARVNDAARANLLAFSTGGDLDHLAADHGVARLDGEKDAALRERIVLNDQGNSAAGPEQWYAFHARSVSADVKDVAVYRPGAGPEIAVAVLSVSNEGVPSPELLASVLGAISDPAKRSVNDIVSVVAATSTVVNVTADIWLLPDTPMDVFDGLEQRLRDANASEGGIGFDINRNWLLAKLTAPGVSKVALNAPSTDIAINDFSAATFGTIVLNFKGRSR